MPVHRSVALPRPCATRPRLIRAVVGVGSALLAAAPLLTALACERAVGTATVPAAARDAAGSPATRGGSSSGPLLPAPWGTPPSAASGAVPVTPPSPASGAAVTPPPTVAAPTATEYPWLTEPVPPDVTSLSARLTPPAGFARVPLAAGSFGEWLRGLPLAPAGTPVRDYRGGVRYPASDRRILAVSTLDVSPADLQQCADSVLRLHAEWRWVRGARDHSYRAAAGTAIPLARFIGGEQVVADGPRLVWRPTRARSLDHAALRDYLDLVFAWANTGSLARDAAKVSPDGVRPGDFFVLPGSPGHTVLVLDLARDRDGNLRALIGQSYMPAQSFYVLRGPDAGWFALTPPTPVDTPFWAPFPWGALRRLDG